MEQGPQRPRPRRATARLRPGPFRRLKFLAITLIVDDGRKSHRERLREVVDNAILADEDAIERSSILVGSPQQIIDKVHRYHTRLGHEVMYVQADADGLTDKQHRGSLELFQAEVAPVLRREIPSRPFPSPAVSS